MTNEEIAKILRMVAASYTIRDEKRYHFQIVAYQKAADTIEHSPTEIKELLQEKKLHSLPGVGPSIRSHLEELIAEGNVTHFEKILQDIPPSVFPLLDIPGFGPKKAYRLVSEFKLSNPKTVIPDLFEIGKAGKIAKLEGFGEKSQEDILQAITESQHGRVKTARMVLPYASDLAKKMIAYLQKSNDVIEAYPLGSLRRKVSTVGDIDIAVSTHKPDAVLTYFAAYPYAERVIEKGDRTSSILTSSGRQIDLMTQPPEAFGSLLQHFTGSKAHNIHLRDYALSIGYSLSEYGIRPKSNKSNDIAEHFDTEKKFYNALGLQWIPPEMRENLGEIELAKQNKLPQLVELKDIQGDLHIHSSFPVEESHDAGQSSMEEMLKKAVQRGYHYLAFSEHNPSQSKHTPQEIVTILQNRNKYIERLRLKYNKSIRIFSLLETDILPDGSLAVPDEGLALLDATIVSIHSVFSMDKKKMTERVLKGLSHPKAKILAHPTGRLLNERPGYKLDWEKIFAFCKEHNKALEINAWPLRLDLPDELVRQAVKRGLRFTIDTDSHAADQMELMEYGVDVARRGWATPRDILNTYDYNKIRQWFLDEEVKV